MTCIRARTSSNFSLIGPWTVELAALERLKKIPIALRKHTGVIINILQYITAVKMIIFK